MRILLTAVALLAAGTAAAQTEQPRAGQVLRDAKGVRLGQIDRIADGGLRVIFNGRFVTVPGDTVEVVDGRPRTKLSKKEVAALN